jgi:hypothetical protein
MQQRWGFKNIGYLPHSGLVVDDVLAKPLVQSHMLWALNYNVQVRLRSTVVQSTY